MRRFYREASAALAEHGHRVLLDGRPVRTPAKRELATPWPELSAAIAAEWQGQGDLIVPAAMPLTRMASTVIDRMPALRGPAIAQVADYALTELLCYRAAQPLELLQRQQRVWQPLLDWAARELGARLVVTTSLLPVAQPEPALQRLRAQIETLDDWSVVGLHAATTALGSLVLGLALLAGRLAPAAALDASLLDELFEIERWGQDVESERRHGALRRDVAAAALLLACARLPDA